MKFARVGSIICITCKGLDDYKGQKVTQAEFGFGDSYGGNSIIEYDPVLKKLKFEKGSQFILTPKEDVKVKDDGTVDLWIRGFSGSISDWCCLKLVLDEEGGTTLMRRVNIDSPEKNITMEEGKLTKFCVGSFLLADIPQPSVDLFYLTNDDSNGFTAMWYNPNGNITGYKYEIKQNSSDETAIQSGDVTPEEDGSCKITVGNELSTGDYCVNLIPVISEGHCYNLSDYIRYGMTEWIDTHSITLNENAETSFGSYQLESSSTQDGTAFAIDNVKYDTEYVYSSEYKHLMLGFYNVTMVNEPYYIKPIDDKTDWKIYTKMPFKQIKKVRVYYKNDKTDFKVCLGNSVKGTDYTATTHTSDSDSSGSYYEYDFTGLETYYKYLTIYDDDGQSSSANIYNVVIDYVQ